MNISIDNIAKIKQAITTTEQKDNVFRTFVNQNIVQSCINCAKFNPHKELCTLAHRRPPARVIVFSCGKEWKEDIPF